MPKDITDLIIRLRHLRFILQDKCLLLQQYSLNLTNDLMIKVLHLSIIAIIGISMTMISVPASFALGYGSIAKPVITSVPLRIFHLGISVKDIQCKGDLHLIIKAEDGSPACVKQD